MNELSFDFIKDNCETIDDLKHRVNEIDNINFKELTDNNITKILKEQKNGR